MIYTLLWYDKDDTKKTDIIEAETEEEARRKGYAQYKGNPPAPLLSVIAGKGGGVN